MNTLQQKSVLVLDAHWRVTNTTTPEKAIGDLAKDTMTSVLIHGENNFEVVTWENWIKIEPEDGEECIHTPRIKIKIPRVVIAVNYKEARAVLKKPKFNTSNVIKAYEGKCWYSGKHVGRRGTIDHVKPRSRGGVDDWENGVCADPKINNLKGDMPLEEFLAKYPQYRPKFPIKKVKPMPKVTLIEPRPDRPEWNYFLERN